MVRKNYFVYNPRISNQAKFGPINRNKLDESGIMSPLYLVFTVHDIDESFLETLFQTTTWHRFMYKNGDTGARADRFAIKDSTFMSMPIKVPSLEEQHKLALAFQKLDRIITLHEEKRLQLERFKKALLQRMFAYKIRYPKLRFNRFSDKWITINLGNILIQSIQKNKGYSYPVFTSSRQGLVRQIEHFGSNQQHDTADYNVIFPNQITYRNRSDDGQFTFNVNKLGSVGLVSKFYPVFVLKDFDNDFVVNDLNNNAKVKYDLSVLSVGTGQHVLSFANLCKYSIIVPDNHEQQKIGQLFSHLDVALALCDMKIKRLKKLKHGLLQKMFV